MLNRILKMTAVLALALSLSACATNTKNNGAASNNNANSGNGANNGAAGNNGANNGMNNGAANGGVTTQGLNPMNNAGNLHNNRQLQMDERIADAIADMDEVSAATVFLTERNAYVAVTLNRGLNDGRNGTGRAGTLNNRAGAGTADGGMFGVTDGVKSRIAAKVKQMNPQIRNVYVSANPDFVSRMQGYADHVRNGHPVRGMMTEINRMFDRMFPDNVTNNNQRNR